MTRKRRRLSYLLRYVGLCSFLLATNSLQADRITDRFADTITLTNHHVYLSVSPSVGRVVAFGRIGQPSVIWLESPKKVDKALADGRWVNYGGDKVWINIKSQWPKIYHRSWPPDRVIDGQPWQVIQQTSDSLTIQSSISEQQHIQVRRTFRLLSNQPRVQIHNTLTQLAPSPYPVHIWSVTQIKPPTRTLLHVLDSNIENQRRYVELGKPEKIDGTLRWLPKLSALAHDPTVGHSGKFGTMGLWIEAIYLTQRFRQTHTISPDAQYPDQASIEYYIGKNYMEMETLSPARILAIGQTMEHTVTWDLQVVSEMR